MADDVRYTPTPWRVGPYYRHEVVSQDGTVCCAPIETEQTRANAEFIVRAVNSHEQLLAACRFAYARALQASDQDCDLVNKLFAAIAAVEGQP